MSADVAVRVDPPVAVDHVARGELVEAGADGVEYGPRDGHRFITPQPSLDRLVLPRSEPAPALDVPTAEIVDLLVAVGQRLSADPDGDLAQAADRAARTSPYEPRIIANAYADLPRIFDESSVRFVVEQAFGRPEMLDGWQTVTGPDGRRSQVRAFPARLVHVLAGNSPGVAASSVVLAALAKSVSLFKLPSNDLFTATAILKAVAAVAPGHPVTRSMSAAYWRGGDEAVESTIFRPQFFDKIVAWGGEGTVKGVGRYIGPGLELVAFDPKTSISLIGREAFADEATLRRVAALAGDDVTLFNQEACVCSRFQFVEGSEEQVDSYCGLLAEQLGVERRYGAAVGPRLASGVREEIDVLGTLPGYRVWGKPDGAGLVIRSHDPVDYHPIAKTVNVVPVDALRGAGRFVNVATQTVGVYPSSRKADVRDELMSGGVQRVVALGSAGAATRGLPHDGFIPLQRLVRWVTDED